MHNQVLKNEPREAEDGYVKKDVVPPKDIRKDKQKDGEEETTVSLAKCS